MNVNCPNCGKTIELDSTTTDALLKQIENEEFEKRLQERLNEKLELANKTKESDIKDLKNEFSLKETNYRNEIDKLKNLIDSKVKEAEALKDQEITKLNEVIKSKETINDVNIEKAVNQVSKEKDEIINSLKEQITKLEASKEGDILKNNEQFKAEINDLNIKIGDYENKLSNAEKEKESEINRLKEFHNFELDAKNKEIERYKNYRLGNSTKDIGESLEQYCSDLFNSIRTTTYPYAVFKKDNEVVEGSKGDFVLRDYSADKVELFSICFEMKNQNEDTSDKSKHKNEEFFEKLNRDRIKKNCEYAILVTTLEEDSDLYNKGIVDVSFKYDKMFVVRPQFFLTIIALIKSLAIRTYEDKKALIEYKTQHIDIANFENNVQNLANKIQKDYDFAMKSYSDVNTFCDAQIAAINKFRESFRITAGHLQAALNQIPNFSIKKLTKDNPTMKAKFDALENKED